MDTRAGFALSEAVCRNGASRLPTASTGCPDATIDKAMARPMPLPAPVTIVTDMIFSLFSGEMSVGHKQSAG